MNLLDRVKLIEDFRLINGIILKTNSIGTIKKINDLTVDLVFGLPLGDSFLLTSASIPNVILVNVTDDEINQVDYRSLIPNIYQLGNIWSIKSGYDERKREKFKTGLVAGYKLAINEKDDEVILHLLEDIKMFKLGYGVRPKDYIYKRQYLDLFGSYSVILEEGILNE